MGIRFAWFKITGEGSVAAGIRRIEALTGTAALEYFQNQERTLKETAALLKTPPHDLAERIQKLLEQQKELEQEVDRVKAQAMSRQFGPSGQDIREVDGVKVLSQQVNADTGEIIKELSAKVGGTGGGRPDMAQGGGANVEKLAESLENVDELLRSSDETG
jgi:alanyl-tRNA synthetase